VESNTEIQVENCAAFLKRNKKAGDPAKKSPDKEETNAQLAPLIYGGQYLAINLALMVWFLVGAGML